MKKEKTNEEKDRIARKYGYPSYSYFIYTYKEEYFSETIRKLLKEIDE